MVAIWYMLGALTVGAVVLNEKISRSAFVLYILFISMASAHHLLVDPGMGSAWKIVNTSYFMYMAVLASMIHGFTVPAGMELGQRLRGVGTGMFGWLRKAPWGDPGFSSLVFSVVVFGFVGGITGVTIGTEQINIIVHNTLRIPGHFHATVVSGTAMAFMGATYYLHPARLPAQGGLLGAGEDPAVPLRRRDVHLRDVHDASRARFGVPRRHWDISFSQAPFDVAFNPAVDVLLAFVALGGIIAATGAFIFVAIAVKSVFFGEPIGTIVPGVAVAGLPQGITNPPVHAADVDRAERGDARPRPGLPRPGARHHGAGLRVPRGLHRVLLRELEGPVLRLEDRMTTAPSRGQGGIALLALYLIVLTTVAWWALALWPAPGAPEWLTRTRALCFGSAPDGLPDAGGWILLVGQPLGMIGVLIAVWGSELRAALSAASGRFAGRVLLAGTAVLLLTGATLAAARVRADDAEPFDPVAGGDPLTRLNDPAPALTLVDQHGDTVSLSDFQGRPVLVTFAFAHCQTVCPVVVREALEAQRATADRRDRRARRHARSVARHAGPTPLDRRRVGARRGRPRALGRGGRRRARPQQLAHSQGAQRGHRRPLASRHGVRGLPGGATRRTPSPAAWRLSPRRFGRSDRRGEFLKHANGRGTCPGRSSFWRRGGSGAAA